MRTLAAVLLLLTIPGFALKYAPIQYVPSGPVFPSASGSSCISPAVGTGNLDAWPMCEGSGNIFTDYTSSNGNNMGHVSTACSWLTQAGFPGVPCYSNANPILTGAYVTGATTPNWAFTTWATPFSVCSWIYGHGFNTTSGESAVIGNLDPDNNYHGFEIEVLFTGGAGHVIFQIINNVSGPTWVRVQETGSISTFTVHQICATYSGNRLASGVVMYIDGSSVGTTTLADTLGSGNATVNNMSMMARVSTSGTASNWIDGVVGWNGIWNCVLSSGVIATNYAAGPSFTGLHC